MAHESWILGRSPPAPFTPPSTQDGGWRSEVPGFVCSTHWAFVQGNRHGSQDAGLRLRAAGRLILPPALNTQWKEPRAPLRMSRPEVPRDCEHCSQVWSKSYRGILTAQEPPSLQRWPNDPQTTSLPCFFELQAGANRCLHNARTMPERCRSDRIR